MDEHQYDELIAEIRKHAHTVEGVIDTEKCYVRKTGMNYYVDLHLTVPGDNTVRKGHDIAHAVKNTIMEEHPEIADVFIHVEPHDLT
jgi:divalent metal cation (Fe/Co/Zn/Cd) transporter